LKRLVNLEERDLATLEWLQVDSISLTAEEQPEHFQLGYIIADKVVSEDLETVVKFDRKRK